MEMKSKIPSLDKEIYYPAFKANDSRFDGSVFLGVSSTGIYCRPVCRAKMPKKENCTFYSSATAAQADGYRPCLLCRPELAPGFAPVDASAKTAQKAAMLIEENLLSEASLQDLANALGITDRHLRRIFLTEYGVTPVQYLQTSRLLLAKSLLSDTNLSITDIAFAAGFGSIRRFNDLFKKHYHMPPSALRKETSPDIPGKPDGITLFLGYRPPYQWESLLFFLSGRAIPGVELVQDGAYQRTVSLTHNGKLCQGWITVNQREKKNALGVTVSLSLLPVLSKVLSRIKFLFDLQCDPQGIDEKLSVMNELREGLWTPGVRVPGSFDPFEMAVRAILGQQITIKAASTLAGRIAKSYGSPLTTPIHGLNRTFPTAQDFHAMGEAILDNLGSLGVIKVRSKSVQALAEGVLRGDILLERTADLQTQKARLQKLPGIGPWTSEYIAMRGLGWPDTFLHTDLGVKKALPGYTTKEIAALSAAWSPWRSYATISLWNSLG